MPIGHKKPKKKEPPAKPAEAEVEAKPKLQPLQQDAAEIEALPDEPEAKKKQQDPAGNIIKFEQRRKRVTVQDPEAVKATQEEQEPVKLKTALKVSLVKKKPPPKPKQKLRKEKPAAKLSGLQTTEISAKTRAAELREANTRSPTSATGQQPPQQQQQQIAKMSSGGTAGLRGTNTGSPTASTGQRPPQQQQRQSGAEMPRQLSQRPPPQEQPPQKQEQPPQVQPPQEQEQPPQERATLSIKVIKTDKKETMIQVEVDLGDSVLKLKEKLREKLKIPVVKLSLSYRGVQMDDRRSLKYYKVRGGSGVVCSIGAGPVSFKQS